MFYQEILDQIRTREQTRIDATMRETSPASVLVRMEREELDYAAYVSGCNRETLKTTHGKNGVPALTAVR